MNTYEEIMDDLYVVANGMKFEGEEVDELVNEIITSKHSILEVDRDLVKHAAKLRILDYRKKRDKHRTEIGRMDRFSECSPKEVTNALSSHDDPAKSLENQEIWDCVQEVLNSTEQIVVKSRYIYGETLDEIAASIGKSKAWTFEVHEKAMDKLRVRLEAYNA
jgi:DNA-directed RNA polymerase specialized sigma subunit